jgi:FkbH-like protein
VQYLALKLSKKGVIIGLCSKNNAEDVDNVLNNHPDMILKDDDIIIKRVNWDNKVSNLKSIAHELNIGLDSLVFIDDSSFEVNLVKNELPEIDTFQVPIMEHEYGLMLRKISSLFYNHKETEEDLNKLKFYKDQAKRSLYKKNTESIKEYLETLGLKIEVHIDSLSHALRISQLSQKTNQFNLTTKRYTEIDIKNLINSKSKTVISVRVSDEYGDSGVTGVAILDFKNSEIEALLLSCRVLGRDIEYEFMNVIIKNMKDRGVSGIKTRYIQTKKNKQVSNYYDKCGFLKESQVDLTTSYYLNIDSYNERKVEYIKVKYGR